MAKQRIAKSKRRVLYYLPDCKQTGTLERKAGHHLLNATEEVINVRSCQVELALIL
jgi:hypothetical protein